MEEESISGEVTRRRYLLAFIVLALTFLAACQEQVDPTSLAATAPIVSPVAIQPTSTTELLPSNTPLPVANFSGVSFVFDEHVLGPLGDMAHLPPDASSSTAPMPEHLRLHLSSDGSSSVPTLYVFPVQQYRAVSPAAAREIDLLQTLLEQRPSSANGDLPLLPMTEAVQTYQSKPTYLDFANGSGMSFLARADHDHSLATEEAFFYTFQGITNDGAYYIAAFVPLAGSLPVDAEGGFSDPDGSSGQDHQAKVVSSSGWIGQELESGHSVMDDIMASLDVRPDEGFPAITLPDFLTGSGFFMGYDAAHVGVPVLEHSPVVVIDPTGEPEYLPGLPDMLSVRFENDGPLSTEHAIILQSVRDNDGSFYPSVPAWQQQLAQSLASDSFVPKDPAAYDVVSLSFQDGTGKRWNTPGADEGPVYHFRGLTHDGRFLIHLDRQLASSSEVDYWDRVIDSILVTGMASTRSSLREEPLDCTHEAEFIEDVSIPDDTEIERGDQFVKLWRVKNSGSCTWTPAESLVYSQGNPLEWQPLALAEVVPPGDEIEVGVTVVSPAEPGIYETWWQLEDEHGMPFGEFLGLRFVAPRPATDIPGYGVIKGSISYPANGNPAVDIYFVRTDESERYSMRTERGWTEYANTVPTGSYYVFARVAGDTSDSGGGYTQAVICGLHANCADHELVVVEVEEGRATHNVDIADWYAPAGTFPLPALESSAE
ncbi:MAG: NBR1-Ig-like domain-containing protein [Candidatus Promineifilaceae bacterium]